VKKSGKVFFMMEIISWFHSTVKHLHYIAFYIVIISSIIVELWCQRRRRRRGNNDRKYEKIGSRTDQIKWWPEMNYFVLKRPLQSNSIIRSTLYFAHILFYFNACWHKWFLKTFNLSKHLISFKPLIIKGNIQTGFSM